MSIFQMRPPPVRNYNRHQRPNKESLMKNALPPEQTMYNALLRNDPAFEGVFIVGVKTTGIFCRPTCTARTPKPENVEYFPGTREALALGYRPCKVCRPMEHPADAPDGIRDLLHAIRQDPDRRWKDEDLRTQDIDPARLRRWFKQHHDMTFQAYLRALRLNRAFGLIRHTDHGTNPTVESRFDAPSGFNEAFQKLAGFAPSHRKQGTPVTINRVLTPLGPMLAGATDQGLCLLEFTDRRMLETQLKRLRKYLNASFLPGEHPLFTPLQAQLNAYFDGKLQAFDLPLTVPGTPFQESVWHVLQQIPYGETRTYRDQATAIHNPKAVRAVASANGDNRISILIPCHRVIGKDGTLVGYGGGLWRKQYLLDLERTGSGNGDLLSLMA